MSGFQKKKKKTASLIYLLSVNKMNEYQVISMATEIWCKSENIF